MYNIEMNNYKNSNKNITDTPNQEINTNLTTSNSLSIEEEEIEFLETKKKSLTDVEKYYLGKFYINKINSDIPEMKNKFLFSSFNYLKQINFADKQELEYELDYKTRTLNTPNSPETIYWESIYNYAKVCLMMGLKNETYEVLEIMFNDVKIRKDKEKYKKIQELRIEYKKTLDTSGIKFILYPENKINNLMNLKDTIKSDVSCFILNTGTFESISQTLNTFVNVCDDIYLINKWICISEKMNNQDKKKLEILYPFVNFYFNDDNKKRTIVEHLNVIKHVIDEKYILYLENDWIFTEKQNYIVPSLKIFNYKTLDYVDTDCNFNLSEKKIGQILFNINYMSKLDLTDGGYLCKLNKEQRFIINDPEINQELKKNNLFNTFSFSPGIFLRETLELDNLENCVLYEKIFGNIYDDNNYITCFYDNVCCETNTNTNTNTHTKFKYFSNINDYITDDEYIFLENACSPATETNIEFIPNKTNQEYLQIAKKNNYMCFNTNGYFFNTFDKNVIKIDKLNPIINIGGTYLRKDIFEANFMDIVEDVN